MLGFKPHPHMLRHACGYALANKGHDTRALQAYLGHRNIQHTVRYGEARAWPMIAPLAELVRLSRISIANEIHEEHRRWVLGE
jgi:integrase